MNTQFCNRPWQWIVGGWVVLTLCLTLSSAVYAQETPNEEEGSGYFAPYYGNEGEGEDMYEITYSEDATVAAAFFCRYRVIADHPHRSRGDVSAHGSWKVRSADKDHCPLYAEVSARLEAFWCDGGGCTWVLLDEDEERVLRGGGRNKRVTVRHGCTDGVLTGYRNTVRVDPDDLWNLPKTATSITNLPCTPN